MSHRIIERPEWGAQFQDGYATRPVGDLEVFGHHTVTGHSGVDATFAQDCAALRTVERVGQEIYKAGISYPFMLPPSGRIFRGVSINRVSAHTINRNAGGAAFAFIGNYENEHLTGAQLAAAAWLFAEGVRRGWWRIRRFTALHRDVFATSCPGRNAVEPLRNLRASNSSLSPAVSTLGGLMALSNTSIARVRDAIIDDRSNDLNGNSNTLGWKVANTNRRVELINRKVDQLQRSVTYLGQQNKQLAREIRALRESK